MVNWYYVVGSDRVGPVSEAALKVLFLNNEINTDTYVWKKGFTNWERLRDVTELKFDNLEEVEIVTPNIEVDELELKIPEKKTKIKESPEVNFSFDWNTVDKNEELFFIKIGQDRKHTLDDIYGPYSMVELNEAITEKRMNLYTLVYSVGMSSWTKIQDTPINNDYNGILSSEISLIEIPLIMVFNSSPTPLVTMVKTAGVIDAVLLGAGPFSEFENKIVHASLYVGVELKVKNIQVKIQNYDKKDQTIECHFVNLDSDGKKIMLNHAI